MCVPYPRRSGLLIRMPMALFQNLDDKVGRIANWTLRLILLWNIPLNTFD